MAVPFYLPEGGADDAVSSTASGGSSISSSSSSSSGTSSDGASTSSGSSISSQSSPNTTATSATQTPMQSPLLQGEQLVMAFCEAFYRCSMNSASPIFQYPPPPSPSCSVHSPSYTGGDVFFPRGRSTPRTPRTSVSFAAGEEINFFRHHPNGNNSIGGGNGGGCGVGSGVSVGSQHGYQGQSIAPPQSAPPIPSHQHNQQQPLQPPYHHFTTHYQYTPPPTPTATSTSTSTATATAATSTATTNCLNFGGSYMNNSTSVGTSTTSTGTMMRLHRSHSDAARRSRLTSTGEDEREYLSEHETSWDEFDDRYENFTAGRERLQEFNGRIPPRKKKKDVPKLKPEKKQPNFTWPTVVTVFVFAMGCGFLVAR